MKNVEILKAIILRADRHAEHNLRLSLFTSDGVRIVYAIGALKPTAKLKGALQLFNVVELSLTGTRVTGAHLLQSSMGLTKDIDRLYLMSAISDAVLKLVNEGEDNSTIYDIIVQSQELLSATDTSTTNVFIHFFGGLLAILGYGIEEETVTAIKRAYIEHLDYNITTKI